MHKLYYYYTIENLYSPEKLVAEILNYDT